MGALKNILNWAEDNLPLLIEETEKLYMVEKTPDSPLFNGGELTEAYVKAQIIYRYLFSGYLVETCGIRRLDRRLGEHGYLASEPETMDYYQKYDLMGTRYLYLRSFVHVERLTSRQLSVLMDCIEREEDHEAVRLVEETYPAVLSVNWENPDQEFEVVPSLYGEGIVKGRTILMGMKSRAEFGDDGMLKDAAGDAERIRIFYSVKRQLESILSEALKTAVIVMMEV